MAEDGSLGQHDPFRSRNEQGKAMEKFVPREERTYTVVGICERPAFEEFTAPGYTLITAADPADQTGSCSVFVTLKNPGKAASYISRTAGIKIALLVIIRKCSKLVRERMNRRKEPQLPLRPRHPQECRGNLPD